MRQVAATMVGHHKDVPLGRIVLSSPVDEVGQRVGIGAVGIRLSVRLRFQQLLTQSLLGIYHETVALASLWMTQKEVTRPIHILHLFLGLKLRHIIGPLYNSFIVYFTIVRRVERCFILSHHVHTVETLGLCLVEPVEIVQDRRIHVSTTTAIPQDGGIGQFFLRLDRWCPGVVINGTRRKHRR